VSCVTCFLKGQSGLLRMWIRSGRDAASSAYTVPEGESKLDPPRVAHWRVCSASMSQSISLWKG
jgi:hypothetical protein